MLSVFMLLTANIASIMPLSLIHRRARLTMPYERFCKALNTLKGLYMEVNSSSLVNRYPSYWQANKALAKLAISSV